MAIKRLEIATAFPPMPKWGLNGTYTDTTTSLELAEAFIVELKKIGDKDIETAKGHQPGVGMVYYVCHNKFLDFKEFKKKYYANKGR